ncbi:nucleoside-diphosphate kinase [Candidatus Woesearchaeota archaeon]|nr:MAG: nucleoside-diphosphate kinase [Candidatus Woesearchaeota archaeon ex4484_78]RLE46418.1 MAG: nucleoside-diphosphate kinase [Candidatus Woesearchaeota archaeon]
MIERTLVLLKPDAVQRSIIGEIIHRFERTGLKIIGMKMVHATEEQAGKHYTNDDAWLNSVGEKMIKSYAKKGIEIKETPKEIGQRIRRMLMDFITMSPAVAICIEGHAAVEKVRTIVGSTAPLNAMPGTIRGDFAFDSYGLADKLGRPIQNLIHASDSKKEAEREIKIWFKEEELFPYQRVDEALLYRKAKKN